MATRQIKLIPIECINDFKPLKFKHTKNNDNIIHSIIIETNDGYSVPIIINESTKYTKFHVFFEDGIKYKDNLANILRKDLDG